MTPEETRQVQFHLRSAAKILKANTPKADLQDFESIELAARQHLLETVGPAMADVFFCPEEAEQVGKQRKLKSTIGEIKVSRRHARKWGLPPRTQLSPILEKCCVVASAKSSYQQAEEDIALMTGMKVGHSSLHRLVQRYDIEIGVSEEIITELSVDGGKVRLRTEEGQPCIWRDYKAVRLHGSLCNAYFQENERLCHWVKQQQLSKIITCIGDGHDGVWNIMACLAPEYQRREVLDWYHLVENLHKIEAEKGWLAEVKSLLWSGCIESALEKSKQVNSYASQCFQGYIGKHRHRIIPYDRYQAEGIDIGSGAVESTVKQIAARLKLSGAQWLEKNVGTMLRLRCAYLNGIFSLGISA